MNISTRLMLGFGFVVLLVVTLGTVSQLSLASLGRAVDALLAEDYSALVAAKDMTRAVDRQNAATFATVLGDATGYSAQGETWANEAYARSRKAAEQSAAGNVEQEASLRTVDDAKRRYDESIARLRAFPRGPDTVNAYYAIVEPEYTRLSGSLDQLVKQAETRGGNAGSEAVRVAWRTRAWAGVITAVVFAALIWTATHLYRNTVWPLGEAARAARAMRRGETHRRFHHDRHDELGELASMLNTLADGLLATQRAAKQRDAEHEQLLEAVLDRWTEGLAVVDEAGRVLSSNAAFRRAVKALPGAQPAGEIRLEGDLNAGREQLLFRDKRAFGQLVRLLPPRPTVPDTDLAKGTAG